MDGVYKRTFMIRLEMLDSCPLAFGQSGQYLVNVIKSMMPINFWFTCSQ